MFCHITQIKDNSRQSMMIVHFKTKLNNFINLSKDFWPLTVLHKPWCYTNLLKMLKKFDSAEPRSLYLSLWRSCSILFSLTGSMLSCHLHSGSDTWHQPAGPQNLFWCSQMLDFFIHTFLHCMLCGQCFKTFLRIHFWVFIEWKKNKIFLIHYSVLGFFSCCVVLLLSVCSCSINLYLILLNLLTALKDWFASLL